MNSAVIALRLDKRMIRRIEGPSKLRFSGGVERRKIMELRNFHILSASSLLIPTMLGVGKIANCGADLKVWDFFVFQIQ